MANCNCGPANTSEGAIGKRLPSRFAGLSESAGLTTEVMAEFVTWLKEIAQKLGRFATDTSPAPRHRR